MKAQDTKRYKQMYQSMEERGIPICFYCGGDLKKDEQRSNKNHSTWKFNCPCTKKYPRLNNIALTIG